MISLSDLSAPILCLIWYDRYMETTSTTSERHTVYLGIDPGTTGGIAWIEQGMIRSIPMPTDRINLWGWISQWILRDDVWPLAMVEQVTGYVAGAELDDTTTTSSQEKTAARGGGRANGARMFTFGRNYERILMALCAAGIVTTGVTPQVWQRAMRLRRSPEENKVVHKKRMVEAARNLYPTLNFKATTADAILIATCHWKLRTGRLDDGAR